MKKWIYSIAMLAMPCIFAEVISISSIKELEPHTLQIDQMLVVFDIDDTLTILNDPAFHRPNFKIHHAQTFNEIMTDLNGEEKLLAFTMPLLTTPSDLIEEETPQFISELQTRGIKTIALTAAAGGEIEGMSIEDRRINELSRVGIDFSRSFSDVSEIVFSGFNTPIFGRVPFFKNGVILTNENDKGVVLIEFLKNITWKPELILFVDDRAEHVYAVKKALAVSYPDIKFKGFHFQTEKAPYQNVHTEHFSKKWTELAQLAQEITAKKKRF